MHLQSAHLYSICDTLLLVFLVFACACDVEKIDIGSNVFRETLVLDSALLEELTIRMSRVILAFSLQKSLPTELQQLTVV